MARAVRNPEDFSAEIVDRALELLAHVPEATIAEAIDVATHERVMCDAGIVPEKDDQP